MAFFAYKGSWIRRGLLYDKCHIFSYEQEKQGFYELTPRYFLNMNHPMDSSVSVVFLNSNRTCRAKWGITDHLLHNVLVCTDYLCEKVNILDYCNNGYIYQ